ncbi:hypothetical protein Bp8pS_114 [Bacillus phage vB_BpuM-BpSp]|nr:hypothetical protein Bp8pS_114 [Bacillus phage vB_BpuM-BpSp]
MRNSFSVKKKKEFGEYVVYKFYVDKINLEKLPVFYKEVFSIIEESRKNFNYVDEYSYFIETNKGDNIRETYDLIENKITDRFSKDKDLCLIEMDREMIHVDFSYYKVLFIFNKRNPIVSETDRLITRLKLKDI